MFRSFMRTLLKDTLGGVNLTKIHDYICIASTANRLCLSCHHDRLLILENNGTMKDRKHDGVLSVHFPLSNSDTSDPTEIKCIAKFVYYIDMAVLLNNKKLCII